MPTGLTEKNWQTLHYFLGEVKSPCCGANMAGREPHSKLGMVEVVCQDCGKSYWVDARSMPERKLREALYIGLRDWIARLRGEAGKFRDVN